jgi:hypothetical protein
MDPCSQEGQRLASDPVMSQHVQLHLESLGCAVVAILHRNPQNNSGAPLRFVFSCRRVPCSCANRRAVANPKPVPLDFEKGPRFGARRWT